MVRVDADFQDEYPGGDATCTEAYATLCRTGEALLGELDRCIAATFDMPQAAATALAVIDGATAPLTPSHVSDRVLVASATMTATLDLLEYRGWIRRIPNPDDRRSVLIEITPDGRAAADQLLPGIRTIERSILSALTHDQRTCLLDLLSKVLARAAEVAAEQPEPLNGQRIRPARLGRSGTAPDPPAQLTPPAPSNSSTSAGTPRPSLRSNPAARLRRNPRHDVDGSAENAGSALAESQPPRPGVGVPDSRATQFDHLH